MVLSNGWMSVEDCMPPEVFMCAGGSKKSDIYIVTVEQDDGTREVCYDYTVNGVWTSDKDTHGKVKAWMINPDPFYGERKTVNEIMGKWIPITERMPEEESYFDSEEKESLFVFVTTIDSEGKRSVKKDWTRNGMWQSYSESHPFEKVVAWFDENCVFPWCGEVEKEKNNEAD